MIRPSLFLLIYQSPQLKRFTACGPRFLLPSPPTTRTDDPLPLPPPPPLEELTILRFTYLNLKYVTNMLDSFRQLKKIELRTAQRTTFQQILDHCCKTQYPSLMHLITHLSGTMILFDHNNQNIIIMKAIFPLSLCFIIIPILRLGKYYNCSAYIS